MYYTDKNNKYIKINVKYFSLIKKLNLMKSYFFLYRYNVYILFEDSIHICPQAMNHQVDIHLVPSTLYRKKHDGKLLKYNVIKEIGKGGFGIVYSAIESPSKKKVALKCTPKWRLNKPKIKQKLINEMTIHRSLDHHNIVKFLGTFHDEYYIYFILEFCEGGNILEYIKVFNSKQNEKGTNNLYKIPSNRGLYTVSTQDSLQCLPEFEVIKITKQILRALDYIHTTANIIHRDIKLQNILITKSGIVKLSDFGLSINFADVSDKSSIISICGTPNYISPEVIDQNSHTSAVDIWGVGVIVFLMLTGQRPFKSINNKKTFEKIRQVHYDWPAYPLVSEQAKSFVDSILKKNPLDRPTAHKLLKHPFLCIENKVNKKTNSSDSIIRFSVPNANSSRASTSTSTSTSNAASNRSIQSAPSTNNNNLNNAINSSQKTQYRSLSPSRPSSNSSKFPKKTIEFQNAYFGSPSQNRNSKINSSDHQIRSKSVTNPKKSISDMPPPPPSNFLTNFTSTIQASPRIQNRSLSPMRPTYYKKDTIATSHLMSLPSHNLINSPNPYYYSPIRGGIINKSISHIIIPDEHCSEINDMKINEDKQLLLEQNKKQQKETIDKNDDFKLDQSTSIIIKATVETIENAAKQAEKAKKFNQNISKQKDAPASQKQSASTTAEQIKENDEQKFDETPVIQSNQTEKDNLDYRIDYGIIPSSHSNSFPQSSVLLWWDYSSRYGLGYILYNGCVGVCFNDLSRIIMEPTERYAQFYSRPHSKMEIVNINDYENDSDKQEQKNVESDSFPNKKKILILKHFAKNLKKIALKHIDSSLINNNEDSNELFERIKSDQLDYIKYWGTNKKDGILFRMNGKSLQASFTDKTSLYVCADSKNVIYDDSKTVQTVPLRDLVNNKKTNSIQSKFLIAKELGKNLE